MPRITSYVDAPLNGISQAAPQVRLPTQATDLFNSMVTIPDGWAKRPPLVWRGAFPEAMDAGDFHRTYVPSSVEGVPDVYLIVENDGTVRLLNADTYAPISVSIEPEAQAYLNEVVSPVDDIRTLTVEDYTFIANRQVPIAESASSAPGRPFEAIVWVKLSDYGRQYVLRVDSIEAVYTCPEGNDADDADDIDTARILSRMLNGGSVQPNGSVTPSGGIGAALTSAGFTWSLSGSLLFLSRNTDFSLTVRDGLGGTAMTAIKGSVSRISDLPVQAPIGFTVRIEGASAAQTNDDYWVRFEETGTGAGLTGVWKETIAPGASYGIDPETLPVGLVYNQGTSTWSLQVLPWTAREVGNEETAPDPLTLGERIMDIGWFRSRLRLLTESTALYCGASNPFRIYPSTLTTVPDSDPFGLVNPGAARAFFRSGITFDQRDVLFGAGSQAVVSAEGPFAARTARIDLLAEYPYAGHLPVLPAGDNVHFAMAKGKNNDGVWELGINGPLQRTEGIDLTVSQPTLLPQGLDRAATLQASYATLYGRYEEPNLYLHLWRKSGQERIQSGFFRMALPEGWNLGDILTVPRPGEANATEFRLSAFDPDGRLHELTMDLQASIRDGATSVIRTCLDVMLTDETPGLTATYDADLNRTTITHSVLDLSGPAWVVSVRGGTDDLPEGLLAERTPATGLVVAGDWTDVPFFVGQTYESFWVVSRLIRYGGPDRRPIYEAGLLAVRALRLDLADTPYMACTTQVERRPPRTYETPQTNFDEPSLFSGPFHVGVSGPATDLTIKVRNDSHLQGFVLGYEWTAEHNQRSRVI